MNMKNGLICVLIIAISSLCTFNSVAAAPVNKLTPDTHSNYAGDMSAGQQTYILATLNGNATTIAMGVGQSVYLHGVLSSGTPPASWRDSSHGIPDVTVNIQNMNPDGNTWTTVYTTCTNPPNRYPIGAGTFLLTLTPKVAGIYTYRVTYDGDGQYAPAVSNVVTLNCN
jgi:hypothetical protein